jgi:hypothetical protein
MISGTYFFLCAIYLSGLRSFGQWFTNLMLQRTFWRWCAGGRGVSFNVDSLLWTLCCSGAGAGVNVVLMVAGHGYRL